MDISKALKVKASVCKRILKELHTYEKELEQEQARAETMKAAGREAHDLKQQDSVVEETRMMIPDCRKRLERAMEDLQAALEDAEGNATSRGSIEMSEAKNVYLQIEKEIEV
eukprot:jgi/Mesen1/9461/ME000627S08844